ncbi:hypothetical protein JCM11641_003171 [Rhodosporidiobolus odoratus]
MAYLAEEPQPRYSFTNTDLTELDVEYLLNMWEDPAPYVGFAVPPLSPCASSEARITPVDSPPPSFLSPASLHLPRSRSLRNLHKAGAVPLRSSFSSSSATDSSRSSSPSFPPTPTISPPPQPASTFPTRLSSKPLPPIRRSPSPVPTDDPVDSLLGLEDIFGPPRANPFPTFGSRGGASPGPFPGSRPPHSAPSSVRHSTASGLTSSSSTSTILSPLPYTYTPSLHSTPSTRSHNSARSNAAFAARKALFEAPLPPPRRPTFDPEAEGQAAFTAPRAAPAPVMVPPPLPEKVMDAEESGEEALEVLGAERMVAVYPRPRPEKKSSRKREQSAGSISSRGSGSGSSLAERTGSLSGKLGWRL